MTQTQEFADPGTVLTEARRRILHGLTLSDGSMVAASEIVEVEPLRRAGYVTTWYAEGGFLAWGIIDAGRRALAAAGGTS